MCNSYVGPLGSYDLRYSCYASSSSASDFYLYESDITIKPATHANFTGVSTSASTAGGLDFGVTINATDSALGYIPVQAMWTQQMAGTATGTLGSWVQKIAVIATRISCPDFIFRYAEDKVTCQLLPDGNSASLTKTDFVSITSNSSSLTSTIIMGNDDAASGGVNFTLGTTGSAAFQSLADSTFSLTARYSSSYVAGAAEAPYTGTFVFGPTVDFAISCSEYTVRYREFTTCMVNQTTGAKKVSSSYFFAPQSVDANGVTRDYLNCTAAGYGYIDIAPGVFKFTCQSIVLETAATYIRIRWAGAGGGKLPDTRVYLTLPITTLSCLPTRVAYGDKITCVLSSPDAPLPTTIIWNGVATNPDTSSGAITWSGGWKSYAGTLNITGVTNKGSANETITANCTVNKNSASAPLLTTDIALNRSDCKPSGASPGTYSSFTSLALGPEAAGSLTFGFKSLSDNGDDTAAAGCAIFASYGSSISVLRSHITSVTTSTIKATITCAPPTTMFKYGTITCSLMPATSYNLATADFVAGSPIVGSGGLVIGTLTSWPAAGAFNFTVTKFDTLNDQPFSLSARYSTGVDASYTTATTSSFTFGPALDFSTTCSPSTISYNQTTTCDVTQTVGSALGSDASTKFNAPTFTDAAALTCGAYTDVAAGHFRFTCRSLVVERSSAVLISLPWKAGGSKAAFNVTLQTSTAMSCSPKRVAVGDKITCTLSSNYALPLDIASSASSTIGVVSFAGQSWQQSGNNLVIQGTVQSPSKNASVWAILKESKVSPPDYVQLVKVSTIACSPGSSSPYRVAFGATVTCVISPDASSPDLVVNDVRLNKTDCRAAGTSGGTPSSFAGLVLGSSGSLNFTFTSSSITGDDAAASGCSAAVVYGSSISAAQGLVATMPVFKTISALVSCPSGSSIFKYGQITCTLAANTSHALQVGDFDATTPISSGAGSNLVLGSVQAGLTFTVGGFTAIGSSTFTLKALYSRSVSASDVFTATATYGPALDFSVACDQASVYFDASTGCVVQQTQGAPLVTSSVFEAARVLDGSTLQCGAYTELQPGKWNFTCVGKVAESPVPASIVLAWAGAGGGRLPLYNITLFKARIFCFARIAVGEKTNCTLSANLAITPSILATTSTSLGSVGRTPLTFGTWVQAGNNLKVEVTAALAVKNESVTALLKGGAQSAPGFVQVVEVGAIACAPGRRLAISTEAECSITPTAYSADLLPTDLTISGTACGNGSNSYTAFSALSDGDGGSVNVTFSATNPVGPASAGSCPLTLVYSTALSPTNALAKSTTFAVVDSYLICPSIIWKYGTFMCSILPASNQVPSLQRTDFADSAPISSNASLIFGNIISWAAAGGLNFTVSNFTAALDAPWYLQATYSPAISGQAALKTLAATFGPAIDFSLNCTYDVLVWGQTTECTHALDTTTGPHLSCTSFNDTEPGVFTFSCTSLVIRAPRPMKIVVPWKGPEGGEIPSFYVKLDTITELSCTPRRVAVGDAFKCTLSANGPLKPSMAIPTDTSPNPLGVSSDISPLSFNLGTWQQEGDSLSIRATVTRTSIGETIVANMIGGYGSPPVTMDFVKVGRVDCVPGTRVLLNTAASCTISPAAGSPGLLVTDVKLNKTECGAAGSANFTGLAASASEAGKLVFTFFANSVVGDDSTGCVLPIRYTTNVSETESVAISTKFDVVDRYNLTCDSSAMRWARPASFVCNLVAWNSGSASSALVDADLQLASSPNVAYTRSSLALTFTHAEVASSQYTFYLRWAPSIVQADAFGTIDIPSVFSVDVVEASLSCTNTGRRVPFTTMACTLTPSARSVNLQTTDVAVAVDSGAVDTGSVTATALGNAGSLTFTYNPPATPLTSAF
eukprot:tig00020824_g14230.t1